MTITLELTFTAPLDAGALLGHFAARAVVGIESVQGDTYTRTLTLPGGPGVVALRIGSERVVAQLALLDGRDEAAAVAVCRSLLDLDGDPASVSAALAEDPLIGAAVCAAPGRRVPGAADGGELAVRTVLGQQISVAGAATAAGRLVAAHGSQLPAALASATVMRQFPSAATLAALDPATLPMPRARGRCVVSLAAALAGGALELTRHADPARTRTALLALPGIGPWTADYVVMRALGDHDVFLPSDLGVRRALERAGLPGDPRAADALAQRWRPHRSYALAYLWTR
jgi:AraC family transcriptional regulator of adaptative response / DNA-3-methyladenine glycosylase II